MDKALRWIAIPGFGTALVVWSVATMAGVFSSANSLATTSSLLPHDLFAPSNIALSNEAQHFVHNGKPQPLFQAPGAQPVIEASLEASLPMYDDCGSSCSGAKATPAKTASGKSERLVSAVAPAALPRPTEKRAADRFDRMVAEAAVTHDKVVAAFARSGMVISKKVPALASKQALYEVASLGNSAAAPDASRFGPAPDRNVQAGQVALALANTPAEVEVAYADQAPGALAQSDISPEADGSLGEPQFQDVPDAVPVPGYRPRVDNGSSVKAPKAADKQFPAVPSAPARVPAKQQPVAQPMAVARLPKSPRQSNTELAYAAPDTSSGGLSQAFGNLFSGGSGSASQAGGGTAIYDISAKTVYMPDGSRLEAHSGLGPWVDNPAYVHKKNVGPTPPDTYILSMRESRFHGVEALRLTPTSGVGKYGRNGILAHTYMLRGRYAQSNGCVAFKNYDRFLKAFKAGKIKRLVVVPGRLKSSPGTAVADAGRGA